MNRLRAFITDDGAHHAFALFTKDFDHRRGACGIGRRVHPRTHGLASEIVLCARDGDDDAARTSQRRAATDALDIKTQSH
jgi:hypothetical protein